MSDKLRQATIAALKKAYAGYLDRDWDRYRESLGEARQKINVIRGLGYDPDRMGRELEVLYLSGEELLITAFTFVGRPYEMRMYYELAEYHLTVLPSKILTKDTAYLPPDVDLIELFPLPEEDPEEAAAEFTRAMDIYRRITGGGDGVDMLYRAALACQAGDPRRAHYYIDTARAEGGAWLRPHADRLDERIRKMA
ncbi:MAG: hypothetical protein LUE29_10910 [Lachnospiraceae bacterium]|nr:hypothetical protein [Lachnospiraceae bacterium]